MQSHFAEFRQFAAEVALAGGFVVQRYFRNLKTIERKEDASPVTLADREAEEQMRGRITARYPHHGIIGEEFGEDNATAEFVWVLDPIDGTKSFISGAISFGVLVALLFRGNPIIGVFYQPILKDMLIGDNDETLHNGKPVRLRQQQDLREATLLATDHRHFERYGKGHPFNRLVRSVRLYRNWGDCYGYFLLATGYADVMMDAEMNIWDIAPLVPIIHGAGGVITDYYGDSPFSQKGVIAAGSQLHAQAIHLLHPAGKGLRLPFVYADVNVSTN
jgi:histidinol phosphatase-like enzyme (inositol monophosphatase family)